MTREAQQCFFSVLGAAFVFTCCLFFFWAASYMYPSICVSLSFFLFFRAAPVSSNSLSFFFSLRRGSNFFQHIGSLKPSHSRVGVVPVRGEGAPEGGRPLARRTASCMAQIRQNGIASRN